jgi:hypothetical protein
MIWDIAAEQSPCRLSALTTIFDILQGVAQSEMIRCSGGGDTWVMKVM